MLKVQLLFVVAVVLGSGLRGAAAAATEEGRHHEHVVELIQIHAWLMWASMGFLFPLGIVVMRFNRPLRDSSADVSPGRARLLLYVHIAVQCGAVGAATAGIVTLIKGIGPTFDRTHMQLGLALWIIVMMLPVISIVRPAKSTQLRPFWFFVHWLLGTGVLVLGIVNCYIGIEMYQSHHGGTTALSIAFSVQVAVMALVYFLQDRFSYILDQGSKSIFKAAGKVANNQSMTSLATP